MDGSISSDSASAPRQKDELSSRSDLTAVSPYSLEKFLTNNPDYLARFRSMTEAFLEKRGGESLEAGCASEVARVFIANIVLAGRLARAEAQLKSLKRKIRSSAENLSEKQKRLRRTKDRISRNFRCEQGGCGRSYGCENTLNQHIKRKHPRFFKTLRQKLEGDLKESCLRPPKNDETCPRFDSDSQRSGPRPPVRPPESLCHPPENVEKDNRGAACVARENAGADPPVFDRLDIDEIMDATAIDPNRSTPSKQKSA